jgi:hypothetical protein
MPNWDRTERAVNRVKGSPYYEASYGSGRDPYGWFSGRHIIGEGTSINEGISLGGSAREAIVVEGSKQPALRRTYDRALRRVYDVARTFDANARYYEDNDIYCGVQQRVLAPVYQTVLQVMPYSSATVDRLTIGYENDRKISLGRFVEEAGGVCRHQGLLAAYILERMQDEGELSDNDRVESDRNDVNGSAHAWARFTSSDGTVYVVDPAQRFFGSIQDAQAYGRWPYARPGDLE